MKSQQIIFECLTVISQPQGKGTRDHWVKIGMAIHSALPNDLWVFIFGPLGLLMTLITLLNGKKATPVKKFGIPSAVMVLALAP